MKHFLTRSFLVTVASTIVGLSPIAYGATKTAMELKNVCAKPAPPSPTPGNVFAFGYGNYCYGYIAGYFDFMSIRSDFPVPNGVTVEQFRLVLIRYMDKHPELLHLDADEVVMRAAYDAWGK